MTRWATRIFIGRRWIAAHDAARSARRVRAAVTEAFSPVLAQFIDEADLSAADIRELRRRLDEKRKNQTRK